MLNNVGLSGGERKLLGRVLAGKLSLNELDELDPALAKLVWDNEDCARIELFDERYGDDWEWCDLHSLLLIAENVLSFHLAQYDEGQEVLHATPDGHFVICLVIEKCRLLQSPEDWKLHELIEVLDADDVGNEVLAAVAERYPSLAAAVPAKLGLVKRNDSRRIKNDVRSRGRRRIPAGEANLLVGNYLGKFPTATIRKVSLGTGVSTGAISKLPAWQGRLAKRKAGQAPSRPKEVSLTNKLEASIPVEDRQLAQLIAEQEEDSQSHRCLPVSPRVARRGGPRLEGPA